MLVFSAVSLGAVLVHSPPALSGDYFDAPHPLAPDHYEVSAPLGIAVSCPCQWNMSQFQPSPRPVVLLLPESICSDTACPADAAICAAAAANVSGVLLDCSFQSSNSSQGQNGCSSVAHTPANRSCGAVPASHISSSLTSALTNFSGANQTQANGSRFQLPIVLLPSVRVTMAQIAPPPPPSTPPSPPDINCQKYEHIPLVYGLLVVLWAAMLAVWWHNTFRRNAASARDLHRMLLLVPLIQLVHCLFSLGNYLACPWESLVGLMVTTLWAVITIFKEPLITLALLLVAKGWCVTREYLQPRELCISGILTTLLYATVALQLCFNALVGDNLAGAEFIGLLPMVFMFVAMLFDIVVSIFQNLRILKAQLIALRAFSIDPRTTPVHRKYVIFTRLALFTLVYVILEATIHSTFTAVHNPSYWVFILLHQLMELVIAFGIGYTFRAQEFNVLFHQVQQVATELAEELLPTITTVTMSPDVLDGANLIEWAPNLELAQPNAVVQSEATQGPITLIVLNPGDVDGDAAQPMATQQAVQVAQPQSLPSAVLPPRAAAASRGSGLELEAPRRSRGQVGGGASGAAGDRAGHSGAAASSGVGASSSGEASGTGGEGNDGGGRRRESQKAALDC